MIAALAPPNTPPSAGFFTPAAGAAQLTGLDR